MFSLFLGLSLPPARKPCFRVKKKPRRHRGSKKIASSWRWLLRRKPPTSGRYFPFETYRNASVTLSGQSVWKIIQYSIMRVYLQTGDWRGKTRVTLNLSIVKKYINFFSGDDNRLRRSGFFRWIYLYAGDFMNFFENRNHLLYCRKKKTRRLWREHDGQKLYPITNKCLGRLRKFDPS